MPSPLFVLVADDHEDSRTIYGQLLSHFGYSVLFAVHGGEAVLQARRRRPSIILMDLRMPALDGWQATRILKRDPATASIPVLAVSAEDEDGLERRALDEGFCCLLRKPVDPRDLLEAMRLCLERASAQRPRGEPPLKGLPAQ